MKQCDRSSLSPFPISSSSLSSSFVASESDPEDSLWSDFTFDFSFLTSEDHKISPNDDNDATTVPKGKELNPLAPQFLPFNAKKNLNKNGREIEVNSSNQNTRIGVLIHDAAESLGLVSQDSVSNTMSMLDISNEFQKSKKLDPLAPVFVPACAKLSEKHGAADHMLTMETNVGSTSGVSSSDSMLLNTFKVVGTHSLVVDRSLRNRYSNTRLDRSSNKSHGRKKLNPLAPRFSLADHKQNVYGCEVNQAANDFGDRHGCSTSSPSQKVDVKKLLTTIHGLSELLTHVHSSETSDLPNEQYLDLINCTVQNLNSYINNRVQEHSGDYASAVHSSCDLYSLPNMRKVIRNHHQTEEQINPEVCFYKSLWLKAKAERSLMEHETFLSKARS